jgi:hypothetical protein
MRPAAVLSLVLALPVATAEGAIVTLANVPDFSQHANAQWANHCAPTAGTDVAYYFGNTYPLLLQGNPWGPGAAADNGATTIIGGLGGPPPPPPPAGSMAALMGTTNATGTTAMGMTLGLDAYMENNWDNIMGGAHWSTAFWPSNPAFGGVGGAGLWAILQNEINQGSGVVLAIAWFAGSPAGYDTPDAYNPEEDPYAGMGHAVTLVGYDNNPQQFRIQINDPANNALGAHAWGGEYAWYNLTVNPNDLTINIGGFVATVYGAAVTNIPEPGTLALLGVGALVAAGRRRR